MYIDKYQKDYYNYSDGKKPKSNVHENNIFKVYEYKYIIINTGTPPITLFFGPGEIYRVMGKTVLKEECYSRKWEILALKNACVR